MGRNIVALCATLFMVLMVGLLGYYTGWEDGAGQDTSITYEAPAIVKEVNSEIGWVTFVDWAGEAWCIRGEGYTVDQLVIITFNDNNTESIYDDLIVDVGCLMNIEEVE